jgi:hypothetical protein
MTESVLSGTPGSEVVLVDALSYLEFRYPTPRHAEHDLDCRQPTLTERL